MMLSSVEHKGRNSDNFVCPCRKSAGFDVVLDPVDLLSG